MSTVTRIPRVLFKVSAAPERTSFQYNGKAMSVRIRPLFESIRAGETKGRRTASQWFLMSSDAPWAEVNSWDLSHYLLQHSFRSSGLGTVQFAEPDLDQQWITGTPQQHALAMTRSCDEVAAPDSRLPKGSGAFWFQDSGHTQLESARNAVGHAKDRVRIAHIDTGYDPGHSTLPKFLRGDLQRNFVEDGSPNDATDHTTDVLTNLGHGTGTLAILAGGHAGEHLIGGAPNQDVIPIRVANSIAQFRTSAVVEAFDYVHGLFKNPRTRAHVISMSLGGFASQVWAEAINALYDSGVFIVTAAGNNFGNLPTRNIVFPARFRRVVAACGVMANHQPYANLALNIMAGNFGPFSKMQTALAAYTPNVPWARLGCESTVDLDGRGTCSAAPQIAAAAALWIQKNKQHWDNYEQGWMRVEAVRKALFDSSSVKPDMSERLGRGIVQAAAALGQRAARSSMLRQEPADAPSFPILRTIAGLNPRELPNARFRMLELEALQLSQQSQELEGLLPDPGQVTDLNATQRDLIIEALHDLPFASKTLRNELEKHRTPKVNTSATRHPRLPDEAVLQAYAIDPPVGRPLTRKLRVFAFDPMVGYSTEFLQINQTTLDIRWEELKPGPVGEYLEVVDLDPASGCCYAPVDLNHPGLLSQAGLAPSEADPRFHQQMVYAVAMKTIQHFEKALGRVALWARRFVRHQQNGKWVFESHFVKRLRIYPHAIRDANSYYSPEKKALLLGYFPASETDPGLNLPHGIVFCCLSHDVVAHEITHALLDGLHRYFGEATNEDVLAFHEAFADIVALFQHFTVPEALRDQIARTQGDLSRQNILGELAQQFGQGIGTYGALRSAIGKIDEKTKRWVPIRPTRDDYQNATEPHERGAVLVAAVFDAFLDIYRRRSEDLIRLATQGSGLLPKGAIPYDLVNRLADEASRTARHVLNICIRALDYCPPVDLQFGEYLRALITADCDLVPDDKWGYRTSFIQGFRKRGIYPGNVRNLSPQSLCWETPDIQLPLDQLFSYLNLSWDLRADREKASEISRQNALWVHDWLKDPHSGIRDQDTEGLGFYRKEGGIMTVNGKTGKLRNFEVHSVRPFRKVGPDGQHLTDLVIEITQSWLPDDGSGKFRGGCTLIIDMEKRRIRYVVRKRVGHPDRMLQQEQYRARLAAKQLGVNYFGDSLLTREPFAMLHREPKHNENKEEDQNGPRESCKEW